MVRVIGLIACLLATGTVCFADAPAQDTNSPAFKDVATDPLKMDVFRVTQLKIMQGYPDGTFRPGGTVTAAEFTTILDRIVAACSGMKKSAFDAKDPKDVVSRLRAATVVIRSVADLAAVESIVDPKTMLASCSDAAEVPAWGLKYAAFAVDHGYLRVDSKLRPMDSITRGELVTLLARCLPPVSGTGADTGYTGLIVDCRGLGVKRSMSPTVVAEDGTLVYPDPKNLPSLEFVEEHGMVSYVSDPAASKRTGDKPLQATAVRSDGAARNCAVISDQDKEMIAVEEAKGHFLARWNVVFLIDP